MKDLDSLSFLENVGKCLVPPNPLRSEAVGGPIVLHHAGGNSRNRGPLARECEDLGSRVNHGAKSFGPTNGPFPSHCRLP